MNATVLTSTIADGNMLLHGHPNGVSNRQAFLAKHGLTMQQTTCLRLDLVHRIENHETDFCRYLEVGEADKGAGMYDTNVEHADALITREPNHALLLPVADCVATTIFDPIQGILMLSHLGRHSLEQNGGYRSVQYLVDRYGSNPATLLVWSSPAPNKDIYPIWRLDHKGMKEVWFEQLRAVGILDEHITDNPADSATDSNYFSHSEFLKGHRSEDGDFAMVTVMQ